MLIKVAARIQVTARRVRVLLSGCWPLLPFFRDVGRTLVGDSLAPTQAYAAMLARYLRMKNLKTPRIVGLFGCGPPILANPAWRFRVKTIKPELIRQRKRRILNRLARIIHEFGNS